MNHSMIAILMNHLIMTFYNFSFLNPLMYRLLSKFFSLESFGVILYIDGGLGVSIF